MTTEDYCCEPGSGECCGPGSWCCARAGSHDHFEDAARAEALRRYPHPVDVETGEPVDDWGYEEYAREAHIEGWKAARAYLAEQEPSEEEMEAACLALHQALASGWMSVMNALHARQEQYDALLDDLGRAALRAAARVRKEQER